jgi:GxxExxY protein
MDKLLYEDEVFRIRGAIFEVYKEIGFGFLEPVYQECLAKEFLPANIPFGAQIPLTLAYKGEPLVQAYRPDFICFDKIIVELKACESIIPQHKLQVLNYLRGTNLRLGLIVNFGTTAKAQIERIIL